MTPEQIDLIIKVLREGGEAYLVAAVNVQLLHGFTTIVISGGVFIALLVLVRAVYRDQNKELFDRDLDETSAVMAYIFLALLLLIVVAIFENGLARVISPEVYAIQSLFGG